MECNGANTGISPPRFTTRGFLSFLYISVLILLICYSDPNFDFRARSVDIAPFGYWNGYLSQINVLECANIADKVASAEIIVLREDSSLIGSVPLNLNAGASIHIVLNELRDNSGKGIEDSYGTFQISQSEPLISCIPILYKYSINSSTNLDYAISPPIINALTGTSNGIYNSYDPSITVTSQRYPTFNWLTITNISNSISSFSVQSKDYSGNFADEVTISIPPNGRQDIALGHQFGERIGIFTIIPKSENPYHAFLSRYHQNPNGNFDFGFALPLGRNLCGTTLPVTTMNSTTEWLHLGNPSNDQAMIEIEIFDQWKNKLTGHSFQIAPYQVKDIYINELLDSGASGAIGSVAFKCSTNALTGFIGNYGNVDKAPDTKQWAYITVPNIDIHQTEENFIPLNTYLSADNWLINTNFSQPNKIEATTYSQGGVALTVSADSLIPSSSKHFPAHEALGQNAVGLSKITSTSEKDDRLLRIYKGERGSIKTVLAVTPFSKNNFLTPSDKPLPEIKFPKDRRSNQRRIGLTKDVFQRLSKISLSNPIDGDLSGKLLQNFQQSKEKFSSYLNSTDSDFSSNGGYQYCSKAVASMGLLAALGDNEAFQIAKKALLQAATPFDIPRMTSKEALPIYNNDKSSNAKRIIAFNVLKEVGELRDYQKGGDNIFLSVGQESACIAIGYDWLYSKLSVSERNTVENALRELLLWSLALNEDFFGETAGETLKIRNGNWNPVMNGGAGLAALSALDDDSKFDCAPFLSSPPDIQKLHILSLNELAKQQVCWSTKNIGHYWKSFTSSGVYIESPSYWFFGMQPYVVFRDAVKGVFNDNQLWEQFRTIEENSALVEDILIDKEGGFWGPMPSSRSSVKLYNYGDSSFTVAPSSYPFLSTGEVSSNQKIKDIGVNILKQQQFNESKNSNLFANNRNDWSRPFSLFFKTDEEPIEPTYTPISAFSTADHRYDLVRMQAKSNSGNWIVYQKGGSLLETHSHLDSSSFVLDIGESRWFGDLGLEHSSSGYYKNYFKQPNTRSYEFGLSFFRKNDLSHNLITLEGRPMNMSGKAKFISQSKNDLSDGSHIYETIWDTTSLYSSVVSESSRKMRLTAFNDNVTLGIYDTLDFKNLPNDINKSMINWHVVHCVPLQTGWQGSTKQISIEGNPAIELSLTSPKDITQKLNLVVQQPLNINLEVTKADPNTNATIKKSEETQEENPNEGCSLISFSVKGSNLQQVGTSYRANIAVLIKQ